MLSSITVIWRWLCQEKKREEWENEYHRRKVVTTYREAEGWLAFVGRAMREENMAYRVDEKCGVHPFVDEEFERVVFRRSQRLLPRDMRVLVQPSRLRMHTLSLIHQIQRLR